MLSLIFTVLAPPSHCVCSGSSVSPSDVGGPTPFPEAQGLRVCYRPHIPRKHLQPRVGLSPRQARQLHSLGSTFLTHVNTMATGNPKAPLSVHLRPPPMLFPLLQICEAVRHLKCKPTLQIFPGLSFAEVVLSPVVDQKNLWRF